GGGKGASKASGFIGGLTSKIGSKVSTKALGKISGRALFKSGGKALSSAIPVIGPLIFAATSLPEIFNTIKHPIESIKHPFKTIGSFFGLSEHPGKTKGIENDKQKLKDINKNEEEKSNAISSAVRKAMNIMFPIGGLVKMFGLGGKNKEIDKIDEDMGVYTSESGFYDKDNESYFDLSRSDKEKDRNDDPVGIINMITNKIFRSKDKQGEMDSLIESIDENSESFFGKDRLKGRIDSTFNVMKELFKLSPLGSFNFIPDSMTKDLIDSDEFKESTKDLKCVSRKLFSQTAIGSLFDMFDPMKTNSKRSWLGGIFSKFFDSLTSIGSASFS